MVNRIAICDDVEVERFVLKRQLMVYFQTNGREAQIQEYESGESLLADIEVIPFFPRWQPTVWKQNLRSDFS